MSDNFSIGDFLRSPMAEHAGISNFPTDDVKKQIYFTMAGLERVRAVLGFSIYVTSGYRSEALNYAVGGSVNSQHCRGEAVDFTCPLFGNPHDVAKFLSQWMRVLGIDQLIFEGTWVHCSFTLNPRYLALTKSGDKYITGIS